MLDRLTVDDFLPELGQELAVGAGSGEAPQARLELVAAKALPSPGLGGARPGFSLLLRAPRAFGVAQGVYPIHHPRLGLMEIFLVPVGASDQAVDYEAVFN
jgi:hypothetical protein